MFKNSLRPAILVGLSLLWVMSGPASAQEAPLAQVRQADQSPHADPAPNPCEAPKKKKKGRGLGGLLKAARSSGLTNLAGMGGMGKGGVLASTALGAAVSLGETAAKADVATPAADGC
jgi:hypothetical protein